ncbi:MAG TPA: hypothetical protein VNJ08_09505 [Bacteriovoracaceae bacterium]|nr:hypothetical protein [Bacteriovoracaceae bacterium]
MRRSFFIVLTLFVSQLASAAKFDCISVHEITSGGMKLDNITFEATPEYSDIKTLVLERSEESSGARVGRMEVENYQFDWSAAESDEGKYSRQFKFTSLADKTHKVELVVKIRDFSTLAKFPAYLFVINESGVSNADEITCKAK